MNTTFKKIETAYKNKKPFVSYSEPESTTISSFFMKEETLFFTSDFTESGFVFSPFDAEENTVLFPVDKADFLQEKIERLDNFEFFNRYTDDESEKEAHINLVDKTILKIKNSSLQKIVISRKELILLKDFDVLLLFKKLLKQYKAAFVYVWYHPKIGLWFGATPETLLHISNQRFKTMSLAGTQLLQENTAVAWGAKELEEQQLVTDFIVNQLKPITTSLKVNQNETVQAGSLLHLKTKVEGEVKSNSDLKQLIRALHPTPAVCGLPRKEAFVFITENEPYKRDFYTGFLGESNLESNLDKSKLSKLYVNLRCMRIEDKIATVYVGSGITKDSNATKEWTETVSKSKTMKTVL